MGRKCTPRIIFADDDKAPLEAVVTISEVRRMWRKADSVIRGAIDTERLCYRQTDSGLYLLTVASLVKAWGVPKQARD